MTKLLEIADLVVEYRVGRRRVQAVRDAHLEIREGETVGLVGESGSGKSTLGKAIIGLTHPTSGRLDYRGESIVDLGLRRPAKLQRSIQMVFQDPYSSLNPRMTIGETLDEPLRLHTSLSGSDRVHEVARLLEMVGLSRDDSRLYPAEFSGGQRQRIALARALAVSPALIIADEITSALDVSVQATVLNLLRDIQETTGVAILFISHDLGVVRYMSNRIAVMSRGEVVEFGDALETFEHPAHDYTRSLIAAVPSLRRAMPPAAESEPVAATGTVEEKKS